LAFSIERDAMADACVVVPAAISPEFLKATLPRRARPKLSNPEEISGGSQSHLTILAV
jgi:hypothetical protein